MILYCSVESVDASHIKGLSQGYSTVQYVLPRNPSLQQRASNHHSRLVTGPLLLITQNSPDQLAVHSREEQRCTYITYNRLFRLLDARSLILLTFHLIPTPI